MKISFDSFVAVLKRSGLITAEQLKVSTDEFRNQGGDDTEGRPFGEYLIQKKLLTSWQIDKLLQGKHKGFFLGKYRLLSLLGKGGMSSVYLAEHVLMRRRCAIKVLPAKRVNDTSYLGRFHREAQAVASLDHPNIVRAYDVDHEIDGNVEIHFLVMEFVDGGTLLELAQKEGTLHPTDAVEYTRQAALGLDHAHRAGLIHRDIKPGNLLIDKQGIVKVMDLGLARFYQPDGDGAGGESLTLQYDEKVLGTADYLAPEQAVDSHDIDSRADIYSLGCTLYFLLCGHPPFTQGTLAQRLLAHQAKEPPPIEQERPGLPSTLGDIVKKMMAKKKEDRYPSALSVAEELTGWLQRNGGERWQTLREKSAGVGSDLAMSGSGPIPVVSQQDQKPRADNSLAESSTAASNSTVTSGRASSNTPPITSGAPVIPEVVERAAKNDPRAKGKLASGWRNRATGGATSPNPAPTVPPPQSSTAQSSTPPSSPTAAPSPPAAPTPPANRTAPSARPTSAPATAEPGTRATVVKPAPPKQAASTPIAPPPKAKPKSAVISRPVAASSSIKLKGPQSSDSAVVVEAMPAIEEAPVAESIREPEPNQPRPSSDPPDNSLADFFSNLSESQSAFPAVTISSADEPLPKLSSAGTSGSSKNLSQHASRDVRAAAKSGIIGAPAVSTPTSNPTYRTGNDDVALAEAVPAGINRRTLLIGGGAALLLLLAIIITISLWGNSTDDPGSGGGATPPTPGAGTQGGGANAGAATGLRPVAGAELTVGPSGHFKTITAALDFVWKNFHPTDSEQVQVIKVAGGAVYPERIRIDGTDFVVAGTRLIHLVSEGGGAAILRPTGTEPVIQLKQSFGITLEGFHVDAANKPVAIEISEVTNRVTLKGLRLTGFQGVGVKAHNYIGTSTGRTRLEGLKVQGAGASAVGVQFSGFSEVSHFDIVDTIFQGPSAAGVRFETAVSNVEIARCRFENLKQGVHFTEGIRLLSDWRFVNNTLHRMGRGIVFDAPPDRGERVRILKNLFSEMSGPEAEVTGDIAKMPPLLNGGGANHNVSTRGGEPGPQEWNLFGGNGSRGTLVVEYLSTSPDSADFLKPKGDTLTAAAAGAPEPDRYIGAMAP